MKVVCYSTPQDHDLMRGFMSECAPTLSAAAGNSGNNRPFMYKVNFSNKSFGNVDGENGVMLKIGKDYDAVFIR